MPDDPTTAAPVPEPRWPAGLSLLVVLVLITGLPDHLRVLPPWAPFALAAAAWAPMAGVWLAADKRPWLRIERIVTLTVATILVVLTVVSLTTLIRHIIDATGAMTGLELLTSSVVAWICNAFGFALAYWQMDGGGPLAQATGSRSRPDWLFPQATAGDAVPPDWSPRFVDYLYLAFSTATAFSTTDAMPLTARAKLLMMLEASVALATVVVVASRAINILGS